MYEWFSAEYNRKANVIVHEWKQIFQIFLYKYTCVYCIFIFFNPFRLVLFLLPIELAPFLIYFILLVMHTQQTATYPYLVRENLINYFRDATFLINVSEFESVHSHSYRTRFNTPLYLQILRSSILYFDDLCTTC